jgi:hypothetical protein
MKALIGMGLAGVLLAGCTTTSDGREPTRPVGGENGQCDATSAQSHIGQRATAELGGQLLRMTGATTLRWVPPRTAVTMDFRADRLTVSYDDNMMIERISCG